MTKRIIYCTICDQNLGNWHGNEEREVISNHIIYTHPEQAKKLVEIGIQIEKFKAEFRNISGMPSREAVHAFINQNTMRHLGFSEERILEVMKI